MQHIQELKCSETSQKPARDEDAVIKLYQPRDATRLKLQTTKPGTSPPGASLLHAGGLSEAVPVAMRWMLSALIYEVVRA
jgi:hypothetical protein